MACAKILVIDDDDDIRFSMKSALEIEGHSVTTAANGQVGLEKLQSGLRPDLVFLDLTMPVMSGQEFLARRQQDEHLLEIPVVVISAVSNFEKSLTGRGDVAGRLGKPIELDELMQAVDRFGGPASANENL